MRKKYFSQRFKTPLEVKLEQKINNLDNIGNLEKLANDGYVELSSFQKESSRKKELKSDMSILLEQEKKAKFRREASINISSHRNRNNDSSFITKPRNASKQYPLTDRSHGQRRGNHINSILNFDTAEDEKEQYLNQSSSLIYDEGESHHSEGENDSTILGKKGSILKFSEIKRLQKEGSIAINFSYDNSLSLPHLGGIKKKNKIMNYVTEIDDEAKQDLVIRERVRTAIFPPLDIPKISSRDRKRLKDMFIAPYSKRMISTKQ